MTSIREVREGLIGQGISEEIAYAIALAPWLQVSETPSNPTLTAFDERDWSDVTSKIASGAPVIASGVLTTQLVKSLRLDATYRVVCTFDISGGAGKRSFFFRVRGER